MARSRFLRRTGLILTSTSSLVALGLGLALLASIALRFADRPRILHIAIGPADSADALERRRLLCCAKPTRSPTRHFCLVVLVSVAVH